MRRVLRHPVPSVSARLLPVLVALLALAFAFPGQAAATDFPVTTTEDVADAVLDMECSVPETGECSLRAAIQEANALEGPDTITLPEGTFVIGIEGDDENGGATGDFDILDDTEIRGAGAGSTFISGENLDRVFDVHLPATVELSDLTVGSGNYSGLGLGGGGIRNGATLVLTGVVVSSNFSTEGGGIANVAGASLTIDASTVESNSASHGGGLANAGTAIVTDSTFSSNSAQWFTSGGAIANEPEATLTIQNSTIRGNSSQSGGGLSNAGAATITNSTFSGNSASQIGGAIFNDLTGELTLESATLAESSGDSAALVSDGAGTIHNTIVSGGGEGACAGESLLVSEGYNLGDALCELNASTDLEGVAPQLLDLADYGGPTATHALRPTSPARDAGDPIGGPATDQRGVARPKGDAPDIGAYEFDPLDPPAVPLAEVSVSDVSAPEGNAGTTPFVFTVSIPQAEPDDVTVDYATAGGSATSPSDYQHVSGSLTIAAGSTSATVTVLANGDTTAESSENFSLQLTNPSANAVLADSAGSGLIVNDDLGQGPLAIRFAPGCMDNILPGNDDGSTGQINLPEGFELDFFGQTYSHLFVNNNGNITFDGPLGTFTPNPIVSNGQRIIAPFWADVDTRNSAGSDVVRYGVATVDGRRAFCVLWAGVTFGGVGYYSGGIDKLNSFQLLLVERDDRGDGDFDIEFNYDRVQWETGGASGGSGGLGGNPARSGFSNGTSQAFELSGSGIQGAFLDSNTSTGLIRRSLDSTQLGRYRWEVQNGEAPVGGSISGKVLNNPPVSGALVSACDVAGNCRLTTSGGDGSYSIGGLDNGTYTVRAFPPGDLLPGQIGPLELSGTLVGQDILVTGPALLPEGSSIQPSRSGGGGMPVLYWGDTLTVSTQGCPEGIATYEVLRGGNAISTGAMVEGPAGVYTGTIPPLRPNSGRAELRMTIDCPDTPDEIVTGSVYIDPSGFVMTVGGAPIVGATVTLYRSDNSSGPFEVVPDGSAIMSFANRTNPDTTDALGHFGWDVVAGFYKVRAEKTGCTAPDLETAYVESDVMTIPPPVTDLDLRLACNVAPVAEADDYVTEEDTPTTIDVLENDSDANGDVLSVSEGGDAPDHGDAVLDDGQFGYTPDPNFHGVDTFDYTVTDEEGATDTGVVTVTVTPVNDAPTAADGTATTDEDTATEVTLSGSDVDEDSLSYDIVSGPSHGDLSGEGAAQTYTPDPNYSGDDSFTFKTNDGDVDSDAGTVSITVSSVNDAPTADDGVATTDEDTATEVTLSGSDVDEDSLSYDIVSGPSHGDLSGEGAAQTYTPDPNYNGGDSFTFRTNDESVDSNLATIEVTVEPVNDPSTAENGTATTDEDTATDVTLVGSDVDGNVLSYEIVTDPAHGTLSGDGAEQTYTPDPNYNGGDSFTFSTNDDSGPSEAGTVEVTVAPVNDAPTLDDSGSPTLTSVPEDTSDPAGNSVSSILSDDSIADVDEDSLSGIAVVEADSSHGAWQYSTDGTTWNALGAVAAAADADSARLLNPASKLRFVPSANYNGPATMTFRAWDQTAGANGGTADTTANGGTTAFSSTSETATVNVTPVPERYEVAVTKEGGGQGTVKSTQAGIDCGASCAATYEEGSQVTLRALAEPGSVFTGWSRDCAGREDSCTMTVNSSKSATATFAVAREPETTSGPPVPGEKVSVETVSGIVLIRIPGTDKFVPLGDLTTIPVGSQIDTRGGTVRLTSARPGGIKDTSDFWDGLFTILQQGTGQGVTDLRLDGEDFGTCAGVGGFRENGVRVDPPKRKLWGKGKGKFRTRGRFSSAAVRGTTWLVEDRCDGTMTLVTTGSVLVRDYLKHANVLLTAGERYLAAPATRSIQSAASRCTVTGTAGPDLLRGTDGKDVICGLGGNDVLIGWGGDDVLLGGAGNDKLSGGQGKDRLAGGAGNDTLAGGSNDDELEGGAGADVLRGGAGADVLSGDAGADRLDGNAGPDTLLGGSGRDFLNARDGRRGNDIVAGGAGNDPCWTDGIAICP